MPKTTNEIIEFLLANNDSMFQEMQRGQVSTWLTTNLNLYTTKSGATRMVYFMPGSKRVLKVAITPEGAAVNKKELEITRCIDPTYVPAIYNWDNERFLWLLAEKVQTDWSTFNVFENLFIEIDGWDRSGRPPPGYSFFANHFVENIQTNKYEHNVKKYVLPEHQKWMLGLQKEILRCEIELSDLHIDNWGVRRSTGMPVVLDLVPPYKVTPLTEMLFHNDCY